MILTRVIGRLVGLTVAHHNVYITSNNEYIGVCSRYTIIMRPIAFPVAPLEQFLLRHKIAALPDLKRVLGASTELTVFRKLKLFPAWPRSSDPAC